VRLLSLTEYQTTFQVPLSAEQRDALRGVVTIAPSAGPEGCYDVTPSSWVGAITLRDLAVEIRPKLPMDRLLFLISYALDPARWQDIAFAFAEHQSLVEAIIPGYVFQVRRAFARGLLQGYRTEEAALPTVRGRLRFDDQIRERFGIFPPAEVRYDEFTEDIEENRLIKAADARLQRLRIRSDLAQRQLRALDAALEAVQLVPYDSRQLPDLTYTRLNQHYQRAVELAKLILRSTSFELRHGRVWASAFLVDMNKVFEDFVVVALREALRLSETTFPQGAKGRRLRLDEARAVVLEPDVSWWDGTTCNFVGDVKYKRIELTGTPNPDLYQLLAYTVATDLPGGLLIYAAGEVKPVTHRVVYLGKELGVVTLDLRGKPPEVLDQVTVLAQQVERLRQRARQA
jgi:5-methylcytosine-specific restriction enzyme subunit McrC